MYKQFGLGRKVSPLAKRMGDWKLSAYIPSDLGDLTGEIIRPYNSAPLDQDGEPECVGFGMANWGICAPVEDKFTNADGRRFYKLCKDVDGDNIPGSTIHSAAKVLKQLDMLDSYAWAYTVEQIVWWVLNQGPVLVGTAWTEGMFLPDTSNIIHPDGPIAGGHGYVISGKYGTSAAIERNYLRLICAWDDNWGINGWADILIDDYIKLHNYDGEAMAAVEKPSAEPPKEGCLQQVLKMIAGK